MEVITQAAPPMWNPRTGIFDPGQLRAAIVMRGWTVVEFATEAQVSRGCLYNALTGVGVTDRTAIRIFRTLEKREPFRMASALGGHLAAL